MTLDFLRDVAIEQPHFKLEPPAELTRAVAAAQAAYSELHQQLDTDVKWRAYAAELNNLKVAHLRAEQALSEWQAKEALAILAATKPQLEPVQKALCDAYAAYAAVAAKVSTISMVASGAQSTAEVNKAKIRQLEPGDNRPALRRR